MPEEIIRAIKHVYDELESRIDECRRDIDFCGSHKYKERYRASGRMIGIEEAQKLIGDYVLSRFDELLEDDYTG